MEHEEALQTITVVGEPTNFVHDVVDLLLANRVVTTCVWNGWDEIRQHTKKLDDIQLLAASSLPVTRVSGWKRLL